MWIYSSCQLLAKKMKWCHSTEGNSKHWAQPLKNYPLTLDERGVFSGRTTQALQSRCHIFIFITLNNLLKRNASKSLMLNASCCSHFTSDWASSLSWWGNLRSTPPVWMSIDEPRMLLAITEHSICQPGLPWTQQRFQQTSVASRSHYSEQILTTMTDLTISSFLWHSKQILHTLLCILSH